MSNELIDVASMGAMAQNAMGYLKIKMQKFKDEANTELINSVRNGAIDDLAVLKLVAYHDLERAIMKDILKGEKAYNKQRGEHL